MTLRRLQLFQTHHNSGSSRFHRHTRRNGSYPPPASVSIPRHSQQHRVEKTLLFAVLRIQRREAFASRRVPGDRQEVSLTLKVSNQPNDRYHMNSRKRPVCPPISQHYGTPATRHTPRACCNTLTSSSSRSRCSGPRPLITFISCG